MYAGTPTRPVMGKGSVAWGVGEKGWEGKVPPGIGENCIRGAGDRSGVWGR